MKQYKCNSIVLGGTFDLLHDGHKGLIDFAFRNGEKVCIGVCSDNFAFKKLGKDLIQKHKERKKALEAYLKSKGVLSRASIITLSNIYGNTLRDLSLDAILVTKDTLKGALKINDARERRNLIKLKIMVFPYVKASDGKAISSSRIRSGIIDRSGNVYWDELKNRHFVLPDNLRPLLAKPFGKIYKNYESYQKNSINSKPLICVGDETVRTFLRSNVSPSLSIVDFLINRKKIVNNFEDLGFRTKPTYYQVQNPPGKISFYLIKEIYNNIGKTNDCFVIKVFGEEDLAVLPVCLLAPLGAKIIYGLRGKGLVEVIVSEERKTELLKLLKRFTIEKFS